MKNIINRFTLSLFSLSIPIISNAQVHIVGSSTVYPFSSAIAEELGATTDVKTPLVEATGSGGGFKLFCKGTASNYPRYNQRLKKDEIFRI